MSEKKRGAL